MDRYCAILGVRPGASKEEIKQVYHDLVKVWHPVREIEVLGKDRAEKNDRHIGGEIAWVDFRIG